MALIIPSSHQSVVMNGPYKGNSLPNQKRQKLPSRGRNQRGKATSDTTGWANEAHGQPPEPMRDAALPKDASASCKGDYESEAAIFFSKDMVKELEHHVAKKEEEVVSLLRDLTIKDQADMERPSKEKATRVSSPPTSPSKNLPSAPQVKSEFTTNHVTVRKLSLGGPKQAERAATLINSADVATSSKSDAHKTVAPKLTEKSSVQQVPVMSRPLSAPIIPGPRPTAPVFSMVQTPPILARSVSATGRLGPEPSSASHSYFPQSYRNAIVGTPVAASSTGFTQAHSPSSAGNTSQLYTQLPKIVSTPMFPQQGSERKESSLVKPGLSFGMVNCNVLQNEPQPIHPCYFSQPHSSRLLFAAPFVPSNLTDLTTSGDLTTSFVPWQHTAPLVPWHFRDPTAPQ